MSKKVKNKLVPKLRFSKFKNAGEWLYINGDKIFDQVSNKNHNSDLPILAITQAYGAIPRIEINYNVNVTDKSIESYKVVDVGDFIISLRSFQGVLNTQTIRDYVARHISFSGKMHIYRMISTGIILKLNFLLINLKGILKEFVMGRWLVTGNFRIYYFRNQSLRNSK